MPRIVTYVTEEQAKKLQAIATREQRSISQVVSLLLDKALKASKGGA